jgi:hypothetical protein
MSEPTLGLVSKRQVIAHLSVCLGCCCGRTDRGRPEVPVDWLKAEWKRLGLARSVHLSISGCVGPCELANVVVVSDAAGARHVGKLSEHGDYECLVEWAAACAEWGAPLPLPPRLVEREVAWVRR